MESQGNRKKKQGLQYSRDRLIQYKNRDIFTIDKRSLGKAFENYLCLDQSASRVLSKQYISTNEVCKTRLLHTAEEYLAYSTDKPARSAVTVSIPPQIMQYCICTVLSLNTTHKGRIYPIFREGMKNAQGDPMHVEGSRFRFRIFTSPCDFLW